jgi:hypothetical protein
MSRPLPDPLGNFHEDSVDQLLNRMRQYGDEGDAKYRTLKAELDRRVAERQVRAANAQVRSAWFQLGAVIAALLAALATLVAPLRGLG